MSLKDSAPPSNDETPDAWLKGALLHAPDAQAAAPSALTHDILRESRLALEGIASTGSKPSAAKTQPTRRTHGLIAAWKHLTRPAVAAGFASVMVATLAGVLWWDKPLDERGDPPMTTAVPMPTAAPMPQTAPAPEVAQDKAVSLSGADAPAKPAAESTARAKLADTPRLEESRRQAKRESTQVDTVVVEAAAPTPTPAPTPAPAPAPAPAAAADLASVARNESAALQGAQRAATAAAPAALSAALPAPTVSALTTRSASPFSSLLAGVTTSPEQWRWQANDDEPQAVTPALQSWLRLLDQSAGSRWATGGLRGGSAADKAADTAVNSAALNLHLTSDTSSARIVLADNTVTLQRGAALWTAVLAPQAAEALRKTWADKLR